MGEARGGAYFRFSAISSEILIVSIGACDMGKIFDVFSTFDVTGFKSEKLVHSL